MNADQHRRIEALFDQLVQLPSQQRDLRLNQLCPDDNEVRQEVANLLAGVDDDSDLSEPTILQKAGKQPSLTALGTVPLLPITIGPYRILKRLGTGGFGTVYQAEQTRPVKRIVALKIIKAGFDTGEVITRFEAERQALALMDHPNIAKVLDAGTTETGGPYFAMEYVDGVSITDFADEHKLNIRDRLTLFLEVCDAITHAHQKAIIHRDIKASNVLGFLRDGKPHVKVIDFGIAKALTSQRLTDHSLNTAQGAAIGTYASMSPEQAAGNNDVDTRTDVYSLGVLVYDLLSGSAPFDKKVLAELSQADAREMICTVEPLKPSTRLRRSGPDEATAAHRRGLDPGSLARKLRRELEWIPLMAIRKERERRYSSSENLAEDILNYLHERPLIAGPESRVYRFRKVFRQNWRLVCAVASVMLVLLAGIATTSIEAVKAKRAERISQNLTVQAVKAEKSALALAEDNRRLAVEKGVFATQASAAAETAKHQLGLAFLERSQHLREDQDNFSAAMTAGFAIGFASDAGAKPADSGSLLQRGTAQWRDAWEISVLRATPRLMWRSPAGTHHNGPVRCVGFSADGKYLASGSDDHLARVWDLASGNLLQTFDDPILGVVSVSLNADGSLLATASGNVVHLWRVGDNALSRNLVGHQGPVRCVSFSRDGKMLATASEDRNVRIWNVASGKAVTSLVGHTSAVLSVSFSPDGSVLASGAKDGSVGLWNFIGGHLLKIVPVDGHEVDCIRYSPDGNVLACASKEGAVCILDLATGQVVRRMDDSTGVSHVGFSPDGGLLVGGSSDDTIHIWSVKSGKLMRILPSQDMPVCGVEFSPDGRLIASGSEDNRIGIWEVGTGKSLQSRSGLKDVATSVSFSPDDGVIASASRRDTICLWDTASGNPIRFLQDAAVQASDGVRPLIKIAYSPDGRKIASASSNNCAVTLWDVDSAKPQWQYRGKDLSGMESCVDFSPDGNLIASMWDDNTVRLWDTRAGKPVRTLTGHTDHVACVSFSRDGKTLASGAKDNSILIWNVATGQILRTLQGHTREVSCVHYSPDDATLASGSVDGTIRLWDTRTGNLLHTLQGQMIYVQSINFSPDGKTLASGSADHTIRLWETATGKELQTLRGAADWVPSVQFSHDGTKLASACWDSTISVWDVAPDKPLPAFSGHTHYVDGLCFSPDGKTLASSSFDKTARLWDVATGKSLQTFSGHSLQLYCVDFNHDATKLVTASEDNTVRIWDVDTGKSSLTFAAEAGGFLSAKFRPDGRMVAAGARDGKVRLWDMTGQLLRTFKAHSDGVYGLSFSPNNKFLATASRDRTIKFWDLDSGALLRTLTGHADRISAISYSPNGKMLVSGSYDGTVRLWDTQTGKMVWIAPDQLQEDLSTGITCVKFNPDGTLLASGSRDGVIRLWDAGLGTMLQTIHTPGSNGGVYAISFSPDGKLLASGANDSSIHLWTVGPNVPLKQYLGIYRFDGLDMTPFATANLFSGGGFKAKLTQ